MTPLEDQARRRILGQWVHKAETDLDAAESLLESQRPLLYPASFHCQQAAEKYLKAFLVSRQVDFPKTHDIEELLDLVESVDPALGASLRDVIPLTRYAVDVRYPGEMPEPTEAQAREALRLARLTRDAVMRSLSARDRAT